MSSVYRVLCLSHDPAITTEAEYSQPEPAAAAIASSIDGHRDCDLLIGRYSYPLVEVGCPPTTSPDRAGRHRCHPHSVTEWVDVAWLRILAAVYEVGDEQMRTLTDASSLHHWSPERLQRLRDELLAGAPGQASWLPAACWSCASSSPRPSSRSGTSCRGGPSTPATAWHCWW